MWVSSDQISHTDVTRCPFCHLQNSFETFLIFTPFFGLRGEERQQKLSSGRQSRLSLRLFFLSFCSPIISYLFPFRGLFICLTTSLTLISAAFVFLFSLFLLKVIKSSSNRPSCSIFHSEFRPSPWQPNSSSHTCTTHARHQSLFAVALIYYSLYWFPILAGRRAIPGTSYHGGFLDGTKTVDENVHSVLHGSSWIWKEGMRPCSINCSHLLDKITFSRKAAESDRSQLLFSFCNIIIN